MEISKIFSNQILGTALLAWALAQFLKLPIGYFSTHQWNWSLLLEPGGMPSSHSALVTAIAHAIGLWIGFESALFALGFILAMIVIYDATGIRRQAGLHAGVINQIIADLASGHRLKGQELSEVLGHTPLEALGGVVLGLLVAQVSWWILR